MKINKVGTFLIYAYAFCCLAMLVTPAQSAQIDSAVTVSNAPIPNNGKSQISDKVGDCKTPGPRIEPPTAKPQNITLDENSSVHIVLTGSDPLGKALKFTLLVKPTQGTISGTAPNLIYKPKTNYFGLDSFSFNVNDGLTNSASAIVLLKVKQVYYPPTATAQSLTNVENTVLPVVLTGSDPQGYPLTFYVLTRPKHGTLTSEASDLFFQDLCKKDVAGYSEDQGKINSEIDDQKPPLTPKTSSAKVFYHPASNYLGNDSFTFRVSNCVTNSGATTISILNRPKYHPPVVNAGPPQTVNFGTLVTLAGTIKKNLYPYYVVTNIWSEVSGPGNAVFSVASLINTTVSFDKPGIYTLRLTAGDGAAQETFCKLVEHLN